MGVPALFRWLSKKYPKIVSRVIEDTPSKVRNGDDEVVEVPLRYESQNPNGFEVDNLYLDMNGIVHPCTHPEGKPAPETEEDMMVEIFKYTERVVNMARPRKVLMMAIDGVAPRAKMNQQRSRRFRAAQEAADKEEERREAIKMFEAMGHPVSEETRNQKSWDTNAITPGTPFMDLLSNSLKYWISYKLTNDPGWKDLKVIISDSSVPGEGEHKIVDWIRRQRSYPDWDPNTSHVMYGLDADLIMLSLATHEPHFRVLREDVFFQGSKGPQTCKNCGQEGHLAVNCKSEKLMKDPNIVEKAKPVDPKPFIFLDVSVLREYLAVELNVPGVPFPFDLELAIDDWIFMIFFVGNDFLPHLPSLEIREGAIDALLKIWRAELPRMGGYLTNHGKVNMGRAQIILEGLAKGEDEIFQRRKEDEDRQGEREKRRRIDDHRRQDLAAEAKENGSADPGSMQLNGTEYVQVTPSSTARGGPLHPSLPSRPQFDIVPKDEANGGRSKRMTADQREAAALKAGPDAIEAMQGSNVDAVNSRKAVRLANMSAAEKLKAELEGTLDDAPETADGDEPVTVERTDDEEKEEMKVEDAREALEEQGEGEGVNEEVLAPPTLANGEDGTAEVDRPGDEPEPEAMDEDEVQPKDEATPSSRSRSSRKRKTRDDDDDEDGDRSDVEAPPDEESNQPISKKKLKVNPDGTVEGYTDDVRLWEPGYRERYYEQKFGVQLTDTEFVSQITRSYMEGLCWVLEYYYQGVPAWDWFYPYHYAPFAQDFQDVGKLNITFEPAAPFTPFAQLLGVFPAASRVHLPETLQPLMTDEDSPIIDFYPDDFDIDMNGKKMAWQGVALLPFIDQHRLLAALKAKEDLLTPDEQRRNRWGENRMFVAEQNALYDVLCKLYTLKAGSSPMPIDTRLSQGMSGQVLADPLIVPNSALDSPLPNIAECPDLETNASLAVRYYFPRQKHSHRSVILRGYRSGPAVLSESDKDWTRRGGPGPDRRGGGGRGRGGYSNGNSGPGMSHSSYGGPRRDGYPAMREGPRFPASAAPYAPPPVPAGGPGYGGYGGGGGYGGYGYGSSAPYAAAPPPPAPSYGGGRDRDYRGPPPQPSYGSYAPPPPSRNPFAPPPPAPYGAPAPSYGGSYGSSYGGGGGAYAPPPPASNGYGGYGGSGGTYGGQGGGYNPYDSRAPPPRRY